ncbi:fungal-specific transcription factor domain-containing protein [Aspergillus pseudoustus]|uniref:Fungal-specific transcription factor domain-containing protein n=1 Tax=Aspergillus pseudoustus TaxID=1810923 RepID=A0ABR4IBJ9_9EURO
MDTARRRNKRSRSGCNTCRARKVKCDERPNGCSNCDRLQLDCSGYGQSISRPASSRPRATRTFRSCTECRVGRTKCSGERPVCARCRDRGTDCRYADGSAPAWQRRLSPGSIPSAPNRSFPISSAHAEMGPAAPALAWLESPHLPEKAKVAVLVENYFSHIHPIRCFAFLHRPSFLRRVDEELAPGSTPTALLYIVCALGAQFHSLEYSTVTEPLPPKTVLRSGHCWAEKAYSMILQELDKISIDNLMAAQFLYDYALRVNNFAQAFMLGGLTARMAQALQINLEYSTDVLCQEPGRNLSIQERESRRRLMWACFVTDALLGSGVDQLTLISERDIKIQLPCSERRFLQESPCITQTLNGNILGFIRPEAIPPNPEENMGIMASFIQHIRIRKQVLRYIKHLDTAIPPWLPNSEFTILDQACTEWHDSLPLNLQWTTSTIYTRKASSQLGALVLLHCSHHQTLCDLYRLGAPALFKLRSAIEFPPEQSEYLLKMRWDLFQAAKALAAIIGEAESHGPHILSDTWLPTITYDSSRIMLYYLTQLIDPREQESKDLVVQTIPYLQSNIRALKAMQALNATSESLANAAETMLRRLGSEAEIAEPSSNSTNRRITHTNIVPDDPYPPDPDDVAGRQSPPGTPAQSAPDYVLNPLTIYRMARRTIPERHAPERIASSRHGAGFGGSSSSGLSGNGTGSGISPPMLTGADELMLFTSDLGWTWQPAETAIGSGSAMENMGLHPWVGGMRLQGDGSDEGGAFG